MDCIGVREVTVLLGVMTAFSNVLPVICRVLTFLVSVLTAPGGVEETQDWIAAFTPREMGLVR